MDQEENNNILLIENSKDQNTFKWFSSIVLLSLGFITFCISFIYILKILGYNDQSLSWMPISTEKFPFNEKVIEYVGTVIVIILGAVFIYFGLRLLLVGKISQVYYDKSTKELVSLWNGSLKKVYRLKIDKVSYLRKKRDKSGPQSIKGSLSYSPVLFIRWNRAYAVNKTTNQFFLLFEHHDKSKFDNKFIKELK